MMMFYHAGRQAGTNLLSRSFLYAYSNMEEAKARPESESRIKNQIQDFN